MQALLRLTVAIIVAGGVVYAQGPRRPAQSSAVPTSLKYVIDTWHRIREGNQMFTERRLTNEINSNGLGFALTCVSVGDIRAAGATNTFISFLLKKQPPKSELKAVNSAEIVSWLSAQASLPEKDLIDRISTCGLNFDLSEVELAEFRKGGASESLIDAIQNARPLDKDVILTALNRKEDLEELISRVRAFGVNFPREFVDLRQAGARPPLFAAIAEARWFEKPLPPPPPRKGWLVVVCQPVECEVEVNGNPATPTQGNAFKASFDIGQAVVSVKKDNYIPNPSEGQTVAISDGDIATVVFRLSPAPVTTQKDGLHRLDQVVTALGGPNALKRASSLNVIGTLRCGTEQKSAQQWQITAGMHSAAISENAGDTGTFELSAPGGKAQLTIIRDKAGYHLKGKAKVPKNFDESLLQACLTQLQEAQFAKLIARVQEGAFALSISSNEAGGPAYLRAASPAKTLRILLDAKSRPIEVRHEAAVFDRDMRFIYADYVEVSGGYFPKHIQVIPPDASQPAVDVYFTEIAYSMTLPK